MKFGRLARGNDPRVPKLTALQGLTLPAEIDYAAGMPANLGAMLNDSLGCCTCAAVGHALQVWSFNADSGVMITPPDSAILALYELAGGYVQGNEATDKGCVEQEVLTDWLTNAVGGNTLAAFVEIDQTNMQQVRETIYECALIYIGFNVPQSMSMSAGAVWDYDPSADNSSIGGHAVIVTGWEANGNLNVISWGQRYTMTPAFWTQFVDECYALADSDWVTANGATPAGMSLTQLEALMASLKEPADS